MHVIAQACTRWGRTMQSCGPISCRPSFKLSRRPDEPQSYRTSATLLRSTKYVLT